MVAPLPSSIELHRLSPSFSPESLEHAQGRETSGMAQEEEEEQRVRRRSDAQIPTDLLPSSSSSPRGVEPESSRRGAPHGWPSSSSFSALQSLRDRLPRFHRERQIQSSANEGRTHFFSSLFFFSSGAREPGEGQEGREISPDSSQNDSAAAGGRGGERGQDRGRGGRLPPLNSSHRTQRRVGGGESAGSGRQQRGEEEEDQQGREEQNDVQGDDPSCHQLLFFSGLLCGFPLLWILGAMLWCITPKQHRRARRVRTRHLLPLLSLPYQPSSLSSLRGGDTSNSRSFPSLLANLGVHAMKWSLFLRSSFPPNMEKTCLRARQGMAGLGRVDTGRVSMSVWLCPCVFVCQFPWLSLHLHLCLLVCIWWLSIRTGLSSYRQMRDQVDICVCVCVGSGCISLSIHVYVHVWACLCGVQICVGWTVRRDSQGAHAALVGGAG